MKNGRSIIIPVLVCVASSFLFFLTPVRAQIVPLYTVKTTSDTVVANACVNGTAGCSLRGAIQAANSVSNSVIGFAIPASDPFCTAGVCTINLGSALPNITANTEIDGPGADKLTVRPATGVNVRVFSITTSGTVSMFGLTISNGVAVSTAGGGILNGTGTLNITNCAIIGNTGFGGGGGIANIGGGTVNLVSSTVSGNQAGGTSGNTTFFSNGGGIVNSFTLNVTNSTITGNSTNADGGAIRHNSGTGTLNVTNSTISSNTATGGSGPSSNSGGGIAALGTVNVKNSIIALNMASSSGPDVIGNFVSAGFNLIGKSDSGNGFTAATDQTGTVASPLDPKLDPNSLQNNGGPTKTIALLFGSPAIDKATSLGLTGNLTTDQRGTGFKRAFDDTSIANAAGGDGTDIGAFEV